MKLPILVILTITALIGVAVAFPANHTVVITYASTNCTGQVQSAVATPGPPACNSTCYAGQYTTCNATEVESRVGSLNGTSSVTFGTCGQNATVAEVRFEPAICVAAQNSATLMTCNATHVFNYFWNGTTTCALNTTTPTITPFANCSGPAQNVSVFCGNMYLTDGPPATPTPTPTPSPVTPTPTPTPQPSPSPVTPTPTPQPSPTPVTPTPTPQPSPTPVTPTPTPQPSPTPVTPTPTPQPSPSPVTPPTPQPPPSPVTPPTPQPPPVFAQPSASCWVNQAVNGETVQVAFFDVQINKAGSYQDSSYFDGTTQHAGQTDFNMTGLLPRFLHFDVTPSGASVSWTLNGTTATLDTSAATSACPDTPIVVLLTFTGTAPDQTAISNLVDVVANITGLPKDHIQVEIVVSAKRESFTAKVTITGDETVHPQVASAALVDSFEADPAPFETATGATASTASYQAPPPPPPTPTPSPSPPSGNPTPPPPTGPNSGAVVVGSLMAVTLLALIAL